VVSEEDWSDELPSSEDYYSEFSDQEQEDILLPASFPPQMAQWKFSQRNKSAAIDVTEQVCMVIFGKYKASVLHRL
jgi:hypothetical protein